MTERSRRPRGSASLANVARCGPRARYLILTLALSLGIPVLLAPPAAAGSCTQQTGVSVTDPNTGWHWTTRWYCGNRGGATMYGDANRYTPTAYMDSTYSWFVCWRYGAKHEGGNHIWYYSLGDRSAAGQSGRYKWGYMPAVDVWTSTDPWPGMAQCPEGTSPPTRADKHRRVLFIHGYANDGSSSCSGTWTDAINYFDAAGWNVSQLKTVKYYDGDTGCTLDARNGYSGTPDTHIKDLGKRLASTIYSTYSRYGESVDVVAHSMGGLIIRAAITGTQNGESGFPPYLYVEDVATLGTPHLGTVDWYPCVGDYDDVQCGELDPGSSFLAWIAAHPDPQASGRTDWSLIGAGDDNLVPSGSALEETYRSSPMEHKYQYKSGQALEHGDLPHATASGYYRVSYCDYFATCDMSNSSTWRYTTTMPAPIRVASNAVYYHWFW
jgi:Putative serine esterase (DUF676)